MRRIALGLSLASLLMLLPTAGHSASDAGAITTAFVEPSDGAGEASAAGFRDIAFSAFTVYSENHSLAVICHARGRGKNVLTTGISYCKLTTTAGKGLRGPAVLFPHQHAFTAGAGRVVGTPASVCITATARYLGSPPLTESHCFFG